MLLSRLAGRGRQRDDEGAALVTVVVLMILCFTVVSVVASSSIFGIRSTADDESRLQALAAAEGGRDYTLSRIRDGCTATGYTNPAGAPTFTTEVHWVAGASAAEAAQRPDPSGAPQCYPGTPSAGLVGIRSTGTAEDGTTKTVLAWYVRTVSTTSTGGTPGVITQGGGDSPASLKRMHSSGGPVIYDMTGSNGISCNSMEIGGDLIFWQAPGTPVSSGLSLSGCSGSETGPTVTGTVYAYGDITIGNATFIKGDVVSVNGSVTVNNGGSVSGSVWAKGAIQGGGTVSGTKHPGTAYSPLPASFSQTSLWVDFIKADVPLSDTTTYSQQTMSPTAGTCTGARLKSIVDTATQDTIVDATACSGLTAENLSLALKRDLTVLLPRTAASSFEGTTVTSADGQRHDFNLVVPDADPDAGSKNRAPTPSGCTTKLLLDSLVMHAPIAGLAYSPCVVDIGGSSSWRGQTFAARINGESGAPTMTYVQMTEVPGAPNPTGFGGSADVSTAALSPSLVAQREDR